MFIFLRLIWPYVLRYTASQGAGYAANFLQARRDQRLAQEEEETVKDTPFSETESGSGPEMPECVATVPQPCPADDAFWFVMSGVLLGAGLSVIVSYLVRPDDQ
ncbi:MAG: hypothetical protein JW953_01250 [Anaerolineae bacterium]|nr:hypothetical protein [Anaerolineae bacterium]